MSDTRQESRVLSRMGARQLSEHELVKVTGSRNTRASQLPTGTASCPDVTFDS